MPTMILVLLQLAFQAYAVTVQKESIPSAPSPYVIWVLNKTAMPPAPTMPPEMQACRGCTCLKTSAPEMIKGGSLDNKFSCIGGAAEFKAPHISWSGAPLEIQPDRSKVHKAQSFAVIVENLDFPYGVGQSNNRVITNFVAWNIPGNWTHLDDSSLDVVYKGKTLVLVGKNDKGSRGFAPPCPEYGTHRIRFTVWSLSRYYTAPEGVDPADLKYRDLLPWLEDHELVRANFYANVKAEGWKPSL